MGSEFPKGQIVRKRLFRDFDLTNTAYRILCMQNGGLKYSQYWSVASATASS
jgi:hypothetical protein